MRNNFNTSAFSELKFEIGEDPAEGWFSYTGKARYSPRRGLVAWIGPAMIGTLKSARNFSYQIDDLLDEPAGSAERDSGQELSPLDLTLAGLASCSLKTLIGGGSARGVIFETVEMLIKLIASPSQDSGCDQSRYRIDCQFEVEADAADELMTELIQQVQEFSPNHRTFTDRMPIKIGYEGSPGPVEMVGDGAGHVLAPIPADFERRIAWITGPQFESWLPAQMPTARMQIDSPKQLTGADWGPNAQELLLMGLAADVASHLNYFSVRELGARLPWEVTATAGIDAGGMLDSGDSDVGLQDIQCTVRYLGEDKAEDASSLQRVVDKAARGSVVRTLVAEPQIVNVSLTSARSGAEVRSIGRRAS
ncbi:OsmC family protein [Micromonospora aurantiaca (nom. illeg.)]|uniref:OsmC family protein n=1 Tax=Micromonospora aurantiaca (nom. illeg.) TaxID=47850 RepID=UPI0036B868A2